MSRHISGSGRIPLTARTPLSFQVVGDSFAGAEFDLPIEVRASDYALITRARSRQTVDLEPGNYLVVAPLPDGQELRGEVTINAGQGDANVHLYGPEAAPSSPFEERLIDPAKRVSARLLTDTLLSIEPPLDISADEDNRKLGPRLLHVQHSSEYDTDGTWLWPLPPAAFENATFRRTGTVAAGLTAHMAHPQAELVLSYLRAGAIGPAIHASGSDLLSVETLVLSQGLLEGKKNDPLAAALGAYVLLRQSHVDGSTRKLVERLHEYNQQLPDSYCLQAELLARAGQRDEALRLLLRLPEVGLPFFTEGVRIAAEHLTLSIRRELEPPLEHARNRLLTSLNWLSAHQVSGDPIFQLEGFDPLDRMAFWEYQSMVSGEPLPFSAEVALEDISFAQDLMDDAFGPEHYRHFGL